MRYSIWFVWVAQGQRRSKVHLLGCLLEIQIPGPLQAADPVCDLWVQESAFPPAPQVSGCLMSEAHRTRQRASLYVGGWGEIFKKEPQTPECLGTPDW